ncbi:TonB-system energizer ExbB [Campylobacter fetus]|uniref:TonB-system energizer ExbB n=1 Tax=Campylobacter fetus TaxID=196 RepID=UPI000509012B|nr:TonB-system energizer ExbB [Campylobacter fetus]WKW17630.1 TonB-system energizer ExbB [Campylobacter fetus subsp. fetus]AIR78230.1 TonB system transport protein ExbB [Campylobacter fetus subsp. fetus 04/554]EAJ5693350.1 TonB-system energizer ExbB [Campylobacter fetus]EAJ5704047.1 TonB-system energizer ExbB [Campylobacter fetus]EAJ9256705.1 TonB-system energizer ExbB [Campylobacter fetus]
MEIVLFLKQNIDYIIIGILGFMSFFALYFTIERALFYSFVDIGHFKSIKSLEMALTKNLTFLYVIYSNAPYVGLLGTVCGIMITFYDMGASGNINANTIMMGLSLALKATALGIAVAIPTLAIYNLLNRKVDILLAKFEETL